MREKKNRENAISKFKMKNYKADVFSCMHWLKIVTAGKRSYLQIVIFYALDVIAFFE